MQTKNFIILFLSISLVLVSLVLLAIFILKSWIWNPFFLISLVAGYFILAKTSALSVLLPLWDSLGKFLVKSLYDLICWAVPVPELTFMNNGYATMTGDGKIPIEMGPEFDNQRFLVQLYYYIVSSFFEVKSLEGKSVLEVSSGRGGGLDYIAKTFNPASCVGIEWSPNQVEFSRKNYKSNPKLEFYQGDAENLAENEHLKGKQFDVIVNIESAQHYANFREFVKGVDKILKPGGTFLYCDFIETQKFIQIEKDLQSFNMKIIRKEVYTPNSLRALELDYERRLEVIVKYSPKPLLPLFKFLGGLQGGHIDSMLKDDSASSRGYILKKMD